MKKIALHLGLWAVLVLVLTHWLPETSQVVQQVTAHDIVEMPSYEKWASSGHADASSEAFTHWDEEDPKEIPVRCAKCHSSPGYRDFIGDDGSALGTVEKPAPIGTVIECITCHNKATYSMNSVIMPSGVEIIDLGEEARCMQCHQGRASKFSVDKAITEADITDVDTVSPDLGFINMHYFAAAATKYGTVAKGGYEYESKSYDTYFAHVDQFDSCVECHDSHTLQVRVDQCTTCHDGVKNVEDLRNVRMNGSLVDYDGDGDIKEGIYYEIEGLRNMLYQAIQAYAAEKTGTAIVYDSLHHPYFFIDTNNNSKADEDEANRDNRYNAWTARLLKAAYNYQVSIKDPGMFAHGGKYIIELLYDSIEDLNTVLARPVEMKKVHRIDNRHFAGSEEAFRHWDTDGEVPRSCSKCHTAAGLPLFLKDKTSVSQSPSNGLQCTTCHNNLSAFTRYEVAKVKFPSGAVINSGNANTNLCMSCHQGRQSLFSLKKSLKRLYEDKVHNVLRFWDIHYLAAGATFFGTKAKGAYEYDDKEYAGLFESCDIFRQMEGPTDGQTEDSSGCTSCHSAHGLKVEVERCVSCHSEVTSEEGFKAIRTSTEDYDGDGDVTEGLAGEIDTLRAALCAAIQDYARNIAKTAIVYESQHYPYFFIDTNENGKADSDETIPSNQYNAWTPNLLEAAYNYQYSTKDPGAFAHNGKYIIQILYDSLENLSKQVEVNMAGMVRP